MLSRSSQDIEVLVYRRENMLNVLNSKWLIYKHVHGVSGNKNAEQ